MVKRKIALLGATGSIGTSTLEVVREQSSHLSIAFASAHADYTKLCRIAKEFAIPSIILTGVEDIDQQDRIRKDNPALRVLFGLGELLKCLEGEDYDIGLNAISGSAGLQATFAILNRGKPLALANKESLVMGGHLVQDLRAEREVQIFPVDSEHSAIFQAIGQHPSNEIRKLIITASGGSFRDLPLEQFRDITPAKALKHPNWDMGAKVTLDSSTMFNKALEVMEAHWLFGIPYEQIEAVIHPQSIIHSMVEFVDGAILAQMSTPDMKLPILYALSYPQRWQSALVQTSIPSLKDLSFAVVEKQRYPLFYLGMEVARKGGILPTVMNAAVEAAMQLFLTKRIAFTEIPAIVNDAISQAENIEHPDLDTIIQINKETYQRVLKR